MKLLELTGLIKSVLTRYHADVIVSFSYQKFTT